jgi:hypothetical protein
MGFRNEPVFYLGGGLFARRSNVLTMKQGGVKRKYDKQSLT